MSTNKIRDGGDTEDNENIRSQTLAHGASLSSSSSLSLSTSSRLLMSRTVDYHQLENYYALLDENRFDEMGLISDDANIENQKLNIDSNENISGLDDMTIAATSSEMLITTDKKAYGYKNWLLEKLKDQREMEPAICDMIICVENETFHVHKCLMIASCDYFDAMLRSGMQETRASSIELKGISAQGLRIVIDFVYTGELKLSLNNIAEILRAVSHLQVRHALKLCEEYLIEETTVNNCIEMLQLAEMFSISKVKNAVNRYILRNFDKLVQNEQYKKLTLEQMCYFLESNKLRLYPEIRVFIACVNWLRNYFEQQQQQQQQQQQLASSSNMSINNYELNSSQHQNSSNKQSITYQLMQHVRFSTMKPEEFVDIVTKTNLIKSDPTCNELLIEAYEYFALPNRQYCSTSCRSMIRNEPVMVCVNESMYILNRREEIWQYLCQSQATCKTLSQKFVVVNNFLYACGGYSETNRETCSKCHRFDPRTGHWYPVASMNEKRQFFTLAACSEFIVAVGGVFGNVGNFYATFSVTSPLEVYSIEKNTWTSLNCDVPILKWPGACVFQVSPNESKKVFIVGGKLTEGPNHSLSQQSFIVDLSTSQVELCPPPITTRFNPSVFYDSIDNKIILFAGEDEKYRLAPCIEIFDLKTRQWSEVATIPVSLSYQCISSTSMIKSRIYYLLEEHDGPSSESYILKSAYFDINTWQFETPVQLPHPSTLASKWCTLVFPQEFLERYQTLTNSRDDFDLNSTLDEGFYSISRGFKSGFNKNGCKAAAHSLNALKSNQNLNVNASSSSVLYDSSSGTSPTMSRRFQSSTNFEDNLTVSNRRDQEKDSSNKNRFSSFLLGGNNNQISDDDFETILSTDILQHSSSSPPPPSSPPFVDSSLNLPIASSAIINNSNRVNNTSVNLNQLTYSGNVLASQLNRINSGLSLISLNSSKNSTEQPQPRQQQQKSKIKKNTSFTSTSTLLPTTTTTTTSTPSSVSSSTLNEMNKISTSIIMLPPSDTDPNRAKSGVSSCTTSTNSLGVSEEHSSSNNEDNLNER